MKYIIYSLNIRNHLLATPKSYNSDRILTLDLHVITKETSPHFRYAHRTHKDPSISYCKDKFQYQGYFNGYWHHYEILPEQADKLEKMINVLVLLKPLEIEIETLHVNEIFKGIEANMMEYIL